MPAKRAHLLIGLLLFFSAAVASEPVTLHVDPSRRLGAVRAFHGVNNGPLEDGGLLDLSEHHRALRFPLSRLHDVHWPNPDVVDMHVVFPEPSADPSRPSSYDFAATDDYLRATLATGTKLVYRLGESIEHAPAKRHVHAPADPEKWAAACVGVIRHYNEGWAGGARHGIRYWEVWNEPDNRPNCWTGTDEDYFRLYGAAARAIKHRWPDLKVGGPAVGNTGEWVNGTLRPSPFVSAFLERCRRDGLPLDFFSWHVYTNDPREPAERARAVRRLLDESGFRSTESHLNEWNYLPDRDWAPVLRGGQGKPRERFYDRVGGAEGAAFVAAALIHLQDAPLDAANYYSADTKGFGLFTPSGVPKKTYHALRAFAMLLETPVRVQASAGDLPVCAGVDEAGELLTVLISNPSGEDRLVDVVADEMWVVDAAHDLERVAVERTVRLPAHSVCVVRRRLRG